MEIYLRFQMHLICKGQSIKAHVDNLQFLEFNKYMQQQNLLLKIKIKRLKLTL